MRDGTSAPYRLPRCSPSWGDRHGAVGGVDRRRSHSASVARSTGALCLGDRGLAECGVRGRGRVDHARRTARRGCSIGSHAGATQRRDSPTCLERWRREPPSRGRKSVLRFSDPRSTVPAPRGAALLGHERRVHEPAHVPVERTRSKALGATSSPPPSVGVNHRASIVLVRRRRRRAAGERLRRPCDRTIACA